MWDKRPSFFVIYRACLFIVCSILVGNDLGLMYSCFFSFCVLQDKEAGDDPDIEDVMKACCQV